MKEIYETPSLTLLFFSADVITTSFPDAENVNVTTKDFDPGWLTNG